MNTNLAECIVDDVEQLPCGLTSAIGNPEPSFIQWYLYSAGLSWVPPEFHLWCALSTVAACVADRVWFEKFRGERLTPNAYIMLIGPSGVGKNQAIRKAQKLVERSSQSERVGLYRGKISAQALLGHLGNTKKKRNYIWLVTPELAVEVGSGPKAEDFVTHMTELYDSDTSFQDLTRTAGHFLIERPCVNWLPGTTQQWLLRSVGREDILGGFFARVFPVPGERVPEALRRALPKPIRPEDYESVDDWLVSYIDSLTWVEGEMTIDVEADDLHTWWIENRIEPTDEMLWHFYSHGDNLLLKLAMCVALADSYKLVIEYDHMLAAIALYDWVNDRLASVLEFAHRTPEVEKLDLLATYLRNRHGGWVDHVALLRFLSNRGVTREIMDSMMRTLIERQEVQIGKGANGRAYRWIGEIQ